MEQITSEQIQDKYDQLFDQHEDYSRLCISQKDADFNFLIRKLAELELKIESLKNK